MDPLDDLLTQLGDVEEEELTPVEDLRKKEFKEIDIFTTVCPSNQKEEKDEGGIEIENNDDSDDEELYIKKRELTEQGYQMKNFLKKQASTSGATSKEAWKTNKKTYLTGLSKPTSSFNVGIVNFDKFQISVRNPKVSSQSFGTFTAGMKLEKLSDLKPTTMIKEAWCTVAVIIEKGITKKSANGNEYLIWKIHDLKDCQTQPTRLLMFGDAIKEHWKIPLGSAIALMSPQISDDASAANKTKTPSVTLKVSKGTNIIEIGQSHHFGTCKGIRQQDGQKCSNFVNTSLSEFCVFHVMSAARKLSAKRGVFNAVTCGPNVGGLSVPKLGTPRPQLNKRPGLLSSGLSMSPSTFSSPSSLKDTMRPADSNSFASPSSNLKTTSKDEEKSMLADILSQRKNTFAARQMLKLKEQKDEKQQRLEGVMDEFDAYKKDDKRVQHSSLGDFLKDDTERERANTVDLSARSLNSPSTSKLWSQSKMPMGHKDAEEHAARLRAIAIMRRKRLEGAEGAVKRKADTTNDEAAKKAKVDDNPTSVKRKMDEIKELLNRKSLHKGEADQAESDRLQKHLSGMEEREKVETFTTTCMAIKNIKVVTCNDCKYTAQTASSQCLEKGHKLVKHDAEKRFFKCAGCKTRTVCFELMPLKHCSKCNENKWLRVAMRDERKVLLETENLKLRGEERTFVNN